MKISKIFTVAIIIAATAAFGCGGGSPADDSGTDSGRDIASDSITDTQSDTDDAGVADARHDAIDLDAADAGNDLDRTDATDATDTVAVPEVFQWASGCEGSGTGAQWTVIRDATFPRGPFIQMSDRDTVTVLWRTAAPTADEGCVDYGWDQETHAACGMPDANGQYEVTLNDLPPATVVTYSARVGETRTADLTFRTMPDRPVPVKFAVFADAHNNVDNLKKMSDIALAEGVDFAISNGDMTGEGLVNEMDQTFQGWQDLGSRVNIWATIGNHDEKNIPTFFDSFALPQGNIDGAADGEGEGWWSRRIGNVWIGGGWIRDFYMSMPDSDWGEVGWFRQQFQTPEFQTAQFRLFFVHQPPYSLQWDDTCTFDGDDCLKVALVPLMKEFGLQASFHGHMHAIEYGESDRVNMFTVGGLCGCGMDEDVCQPQEGFPDPWHRIYGVPSFAIVETACDGLKIRMVDLDGNEVATATVPEVPIHYDENIRLMSFNLRMPFDSTPGQRWEDRKQPALNVINEFGPDIMVIQEGYLDTMNFIQENIPRLTWIGENRSGGFIDEYSAIFYDNTKYEMIETKTLALSHTPDVIGTKVDDADQLYPRIVTWGHFRRIADGFEFDVFATHWDHTGVDGIREEMAVITLQQVAALAGGRPVLLAGDFNCGYQSVPYNVMTGAAEWEGVTGSMTDTWVELGKPEEGTFHNFTGVADNVRIDWMLHNGGFKALDAGIIKSSYDGVYPSDHFPVGAEFRITRP